MGSSTNLLEQYYRQQYALFVDTLSHWGSFDDIELYHKLRVAIKNIKAIHQMLSPVMADSFMATQLNWPYEKIFNRSGKLRRWYLNQQLAIQYDINQEVEKKYLHFAGKKLRQKKWIIRHTYIKQVLHRTEKTTHKVSEIFNHLPGDEIKIRVCQFISYKMTLIRQLFNEQMNEPIIHQIRIHIREIKAVLNLLPKQYYPSEFYKMIEETSDCIGKWHDRVDFNSSVKQFSRKHRKLQHFMQPMILKMKKELSTFTTQIDQMIDNLFLLYDRPDFLAQKKPVK